MMRSTDMRGFFSSSSSSVGAAAEGVFERWCEQGLERFLTSITTYETETMGARLNASMQMAVRSFLSSVSHIDDLDQAVRYVQAAILVDDLTLLDIVRLRQAEALLKTKPSLRASYPGSRLSRMIASLQKALDTGFESFYALESPEKERMLREAHPAILSGLREFRGVRSGNLLHEAVLAGSLPAVRTAIALGIPAKSNEQGQYPLHLAAERATLRANGAADSKIGPDYLAMIQCLVERYPDSLDKQDILGRTPLYLAVDSAKGAVEPRCERTATVLIDRGADRRVRSLLGSTPEDCMRCSRRLSVLLVVREDFPEEAVVVEESGPESIAVDTGRHSPSSDPEPRRRTSLSAVPL